MKKSMSRLAAILAVSTAFMTSLPSVSNADEMERRKSSVIDKQEQTFKAAQIDLTNIKDREIIIQTKGNVDSIIKRFGVQLVDAPSILKERGILVVKVPKSLSYVSVLQKMKNSSLIESADPNYIQVKTGLTNPNDEYLSNQWYLSQIGVPTIWNNLEPTNEKVRIAVLDSGVDYTHPELDGQVLPGYDAYDDDDDPMDTLGHGTAIAGIIAANTNNGMGIAGINPYAEILPIKIGDSEGVSTSSSITGIYTAIKNRANIINLSYGGYDFIDAEYAAIYEAYRKGILVVAASGNDGEEGKPVCYPAGYFGALSVGSTNKWDQVSDFTNIGYALDITAPGEDILTTLLNDEYALVYGTSYSSPVVAGVASLLLAKNKKLSPDQLEYLLQKGAKPLIKNSNNWSANTGYGRVDAVGMMNAKLPSLSSDAGNSRSKAKTVTLNKTYKNKYDMPGDEDWYKLKIKKTTKVKVELSGVNNMDSYIWMDQYSGGTVKWEKEYDRADIGKKESFTRTLKPGTYYFQIYEYYNHWSPLNYSFKVSKVK